ncbi:MAG: FMN-binding protein [Treponemataceae bacterium]
MKKSMIFLTILFFVGFGMYAKDGTYTATKEGKRGDISVAVTIKKDKITDIKVLKSMEDAKYALEKISKTIIQENNTNVDVVSGASMTSKAIVSAVEDAVSQAGLNLKGKKIKPLTKI